jgi:hypothetical protein
MDDTPRPPADIAARPEGARREPNSAAKTAEMAEDLVAVSRLTGGRAVH